MSSESSKLSSSSITFAQDVSYLAENQYVPLNKEIEVRIERLAKNVQNIASEDFKKLGSNFQARIFEHAISQGDTKKLDAHLTDEIASFLIKTEGGKQLATKYYLNISSSPSGKCLKLQSAYLTHDEVKKILEGIDPKERGEITTVDLSGCRINDLSLLNGFENLSVLNLTRCITLDKLSGIEVLPEIKEIKISGCYRLQSLKGLEGVVKLDKLDAGGCINLKNIEAIAKLPLRELDLSDCDLLASLAPIEKLMKLEKLQLKNLMNLTTLNRCKGLVSLVYLDVSGSRVNDIKGLAGLSKSLDFRCTGCPIEKTLAESNKLNSKQDVKSNH